MHQVELSEGAMRDLMRIRVRDRRATLDPIERRLRREPMTPTRNRKMLVTMVPPFEAVLPIWELRVGDWWVFYDVESEVLKV